MHRDRVSIKTKIVVLLLCFSTVGCVRRRMTIRSYPEGARVFVDDQEVGITPVSTSFTYHAPRKIHLSKDGYESLTVKENFSPPWYEYPVIEFFSENVWPWEVRDERFVDLQLEPQRIVPKEELLGRARAIRIGANAGGPLPMTVPSVTPGSPTNPPMTPLLPGNQLPAPASKRTE